MGTSLYCDGTLKRATPHLFRDNGVRCTHIMTVVAKILIEAFYGRPAERAYFMGSSAGGKQAITEAERFPEDYDGIIAGVPSNNALPLITYFLWSYVHLTTREGYPLIGTALASRISDEAARFFSERGCAERGSDYVEYSYAGEDTVDAFLAHLAVALPELDAAQMDALRAVYSGPVNPKNGKRIYTGMPIGSEIDCGYMRDTEEPQPFDFPWFSLYFGEDFCPHDFDFSDDYERMSADIGPDFTFNDPDLSAFRARGGRLLIFSGISDFWGPWPEAVHYYNGICRHFGGDEAAAEVVRLFLLPGKGHNIKGRGANAWWADEDRLPLLDAVRAWCVEGRAPDSLVAAHLENLGATDGSERVRWMRRIPRYRGMTSEGLDYPCVCHPDYAMPKGRGK
jgi:feruloyl esterase